MSEAPATEGSAVTTQKYLTALLNAFPGNLTLPGTNLYLIPVKPLTNNPAFGM